VQQLLEILKDSGKVLSEPHQSQLPSHGQVEEGCGLLENSGGSPLDKPAQFILMMKLEKAKLTILFPLESPRTTTASRRQDLPQAALSTV